MWTVMSSRGASLAEAASYSEHVVGAGATSRPPPDDVNGDQKPTLQAVCI